LTANLAANLRSGKIRIVIIEDNVTLSSAIAYRLKDRGHAVDVLHDGLEADMYLRKEGADLIVLDINLPGMSGLDVLYALRQRGAQTPVILLTARIETRDRVLGLDRGADDYMVKPFEMDELEARIRALSRRKNLEYSSHETLGRLVFDRSTRQVTVDNQPLDLPRKELATFECLIERKGRLVSKSQIIDHVYGVGAEVDDTAIEPHISRLRRRLAECGVQIKTARGLGYLLEVEG